MKQKTLHTIGYEGSSIGDFLATLEAVGIDLLIDVRDVPISRKRGFSKTALSGWWAEGEAERLRGLMADPQQKGRPWDEFRAEIVALIEREGK